MGLVLLYSTAVLHYGPCAAIQYCSITLWALCCYTVLQYYIMGLVLLYSTAVLHYEPDAAGLIRSVVIIVHCYVYMHACNYYSACLVTLHFSALL